MSTPLQAPTANITATRFSGGKQRGTCIQLTKPKDTATGFDTLALTREDALAVAETLLSFGLGKEIPEMPDEVAEYPEPRATRDNKGRDCIMCDAGVYAETSIMDDIQGVVHCTSCGHEITRHVHLTD